MIRHFQWGIIFVITLAFSANTALSQSWYNSSWKYRQGLTIDSDHADFSLSSTLTQFPVLIRLTNGSNDLFGKAVVPGVYYIVVKIDRQRYVQKALVVK